MTSGISRWHREAEARLTDGVPDGWLAPWLRTSIRVVVFFLLPSIPFVVFGVLPERFAWTASPVLFLYAWTTLLSELRHGRPWLSIMTASVLWAGFFLIEYIGVRTGFPFGAYQYSGNLSFALAGVPLAIGAAWYAAIINSWRLAAWLMHSRRGRDWKIPLVAGILTIAFDVALEPMASAVRGYWVWDGGSIPLQNYLSWFALSLLAVGFVHHLHGPATRGVAGSGMTGALLYGLQIVLFLMAALVHGHFASAAVTIGLLAAVLGARFAAGDVPGREPVPRG